MSTSVRATAIRFDELSMWVELDEDISVAGLLAGRGDQTMARKHAA
jgi:hypothetical protein